MRFSTLAVAATAAGLASAQSICDKYTTALLKNNTAANQFALVTLLVKTAALGNYTGPGTANPTLPGSMVNFPGLLANGTVNGQTVSLAPYFTGALASSNQGGMPAAINWLDGGNATLLITDPMSVGNAGSNQATLFVHLVSYFGVLLGCSQYGKDGFAAYAGSNNQYNVHKYMDISEAEFTYFIQNVGMSAKSFGATDADITTVANSLNSTFGQRCAPAAVVVPGTTAEQQVMCIGTGCPLAASPEAGCSGLAAVAGYTPSMAALATATSGASSASGSATASGASSAVTSSLMAATGTAAAAASSAAASGASAASSAAGNYAPRQTAAAGLMAGAALVAAAML